MHDWTPPNQEHPPPKTGEPALHQAARVGDEATIRRLITAGERIDAPFDLQLDPGACPANATPLMIAAASGDGASLATVRLLIELGANPRIEMDGKSAAAWACSGLGWNYRPGGDAARLNFLLDIGVPLPRRGERAGRMLCAVAAAGDSERLGILLREGLPAGGDWNPEAARRRADAMRLNRSAVPDPFADLPEELREELAASMRVWEEDLFQKQWSAPSSYEIPLFQAASSGSVECVKLLLEYGADPLQRDTTKSTAMYHAASLPVVRQLMSAGLPLEDADDFGWSPLSAAVCDGRNGLPRIRALIEAGADVNGTHDRGYTVFMSAASAMERDVEVLRLLVAAGADPQAVTDLGYNAFHAAIDVNGVANAEASVRSILSYLKQLGVDIHHRNQAGVTPLGRAQVEGTEIEVQVLRELGARE